MKEVERIYALARCSNGRWLLLNRRYKPFGIGASPRSWFVYECCDGSRASLRERDLKKIDGGSRRYRSGDRIVWLYSDANDPRLSSAYFRAYERRVAELDIVGEEEVA